MGEMTEKKRAVSAPEELQFTGTLAYAISAAAAILMCADTHSNAYHRDKRACVMEKRRRRESVRLPDQIYDR